ncbi:protein cereblon isoform X2 [Amyelois transitella]|uniref:protein cereblon isoform X2 n=1 Tax=Amyelois transitella TaxID=680683 RepID=UPI00298F4E6B|nr:protein cereblon isoform X2 [Amyelois transitella]
MFIIFKTLLLLSSVSVNLLTFAEEYSNPENNGQEILLCRKCGADVADSHYLFSIPSSGAHKTEKQNLFGRQNVTVQTLVNPFGIKFEIVTAQKARCENIGPHQAADSWFPGYVWQICTCPHCGQHLGWTFESVDNSDTKDETSLMKVHSFHGLILSNILGENFTNSLIMMPKVFNM